MKPEAHADALLSVALSLAGQAKTSEPVQQAELRRAVSTAYYAIFHQIRMDYADFLVGTTQSARATTAWSAAYRTLNHGPLANAAQNLRNRAEIPQNAHQFFEEFADLKGKRERADYDVVPDFDTVEVLNAVATAERALRNYRDLSASVRRQSLAHVLAQGKQKR